MTQSPADLPDDVLGQLGNRVQHALRAFTPDDAAALAKAVKTYPKTADYDLAQTLTQLGTGEAIITVLAESGAPTPVAWTRLRAPRSLMGQIDASAQQQAVAASPLQANYGAGDRPRLGLREAERQAGGARRPGRTTSRPKSTAVGRSPRRAAAGGVLGGLLASPAFKSFTRSAASALGREITRGIFGTRKRR